MKVAPIVNPGFRERETGSLQVCIQENPVFIKSRRRALFRLFVLRVGESVEIYTAFFFLFFTSFACLLCACAFLSVKSAWKCLDRSVITS